MVLEEKKVKNDSLYIVMPAYNEEANIEETVKSWYEVLNGKADSSKLVIADSGSNDRTHEILLQLQSKYPKLFILDKTDRYHGPKVISLYDYAIKNGADFIFQTDSDGQTDPGEFEQFWEKRSDFDGLFGRRINRGDGKIRTLVEYVVCLLLFLYFGVKVPDANAPFRLMKTEIVKKYLYKLKPDYNLPNIMMTTFFVFNHEKTTFIPISFKSRQGGTNSIDIPKIVAIGWKALSDFWGFKKEMS